MLTLIPSQDKDTIALELDGKVAEEELEKLDRVIQEKFGENGQFNLFLVVHDFDGASLKMMAEETKIDMKRWSQYAKMAVVSEKNWLETMTDFSDYLPGIKTRHFKMDQLDEAWLWIKS